MSKTKTQHKTIEDYEEEAKRLIEPVYDGMYKNEVQYENDFRIWKKSVQLMLLDILERLPRSSK